MNTQVGRGQVQRSDRLMPDEAAREFLKRCKVAHVATINTDGWPYVIPLAYVYEGDSKLFLHTGNIRPSQFLSNIQNDARVCLEVCEMGDVIPGQRYACQSSVVYTSVIAYGSLTILEDNERKTWFFDRLWEKYGDPNWKFEQSGYPAIGKIVLYEMSLDTVTGKQSQGFRH